MNHVNEFRSAGTSPPEQLTPTHREKRMRRTAEQQAALDSLEAIAGRYRVTLDDEGWPVIESRMDRGRIEYHDGRLLALHFESAKCEAQVARYVKAGCRRDQVGDTEARLLFEPALLGTIAKMIYAKTRRSPDTVAHLVGQGQFVDGGRNPRRKGAPLGSPSTSS